MVLLPVIKTTSCDKWWSADCCAEECPHSDNSASAGQRPVWKLQGPTLDDSTEYTYFYSDRNITLNLFMTSILWNKTIAKSAYFIVILYLGHFGVSALMLNDLLAIYHSIWVQNFFDLLIFYWRFLAAGVIFSCHYYQVGVFSIQTIFSHCLFELNHL